MNWFSMVNPDISLAKTPDTRFYTDPATFAESRQTVFVPSWQYVGDRSAFSASVNCLPVNLLPDLLDEPLLLTKNHDAIHCVSNVCTHRGNVMVVDPCYSPHIRCKYHGRMFGLDGCFRSMPEFQEVKEFPSAEDNLTSLPVHAWGDLLFASLGHHPVERYFGEMFQRLSFLPLAEFKLVDAFSKTYPVKAHWALYCENYLEGFHIPFVHAGLNAVIEYSSYTTEMYDWSSLQLALAKEGEPFFELPPDSPDFGKKVAAYYYFIFPNMMFNFYPWGLSLNIVEPKGTSSTQVRFLTYIWKPELHNQGAGSDLHTVEMEDEEVVELCQRGVRSALYKHGRYSVTREQGTHHFHQMLRASFS